MRTHHPAVRHIVPRRTPRWAHPRLSVRYNLEWDPLHVDVGQSNGGWASFVRSLGRAKTWVADQFSIGLAVTIIIVVLMTLAVLVGDSLIHALTVWMGR